MLLSEPKPASHLHASLAGCSHRGCFTSKTTDLCEAGKFFKELEVPQSDLKPGSCPQTPGPTSRLRAVSQLRQAAQSQQFRNEAEAPHQLPSELQHRQFGLVCFPFYFILGIALYHCRLRWCFFNCLLILKRA